MKNASSLLVLFLLSITGYSQYRSGYIPVGMPSDLLVQESNVVDGIVTHNYGGNGSIPVNGNPFLIEEFRPGVLELHDGNKSSEILMRYNVAKDLFEILKNNDTLTVNRPYAIKYVFLDDKVFIFDPKLRKDVERSYNGFFQLRIDGKLSLYIKRSKKMSMDNFVPNYKGGGGTKEYYYVDKVRFIGKNKDDKTFLITSAKSLLNRLDDHKAEIKAFIKQNKIKFKKEGDLVTLFEYYNSL